MKPSDIERLKNIADRGGSRALAEKLIDPFDEVARAQRCSYRLLKHGVLYERGSGNAVFSIYFSRTSAKTGTVEVAFADDNIARIYGRAATEVADWVRHLRTTIGVAAKSPTSQRYPRVAIATVEAGRALASAIGSFLAGDPHVPTEQNDDAAGAERLDVDERTLAAIWTRRGQPVFRDQLLDAYGSRCAVTGCDAVDALEAAHIVPFHQDQSYLVGNGILLRADIHTLFDLFLISVNPATWTVHFAHSLLSSYGTLEGATFRLPENFSLRPDPERMAAHYREWQKRRSGSA